MRTMAERVQKEAEAMWGTMTALSHSASPDFILGSSSNTSSPTLHSKQLLTPMLMQRACEQPEDRQAAAG